MEVIRRISAVVFAVATLLSAPAAAECVAAPELAAFQAATPDDFAAGPTRADRLGRVVAPVSVNGQGPFRFIVDTGANRSSVSQGLAEQLGLTPSGEGQVHTVYGVTTAPLVDVLSLRYRELELQNAPMPVLAGSVLAGEHGLLGVDGMRGRRLRIDFDRNCIEIVDARRVTRLARGWTTMPGQLRFGHLVVMRGRVNGVPVSMFLDTGSNSTLGNFALRDRLRERSGVRTMSVDPVRAYTAGEPVILDTGMALPRIVLGDIEVRDVIAYVGDFHIFEVWNLTEEPALLIGMDVLAQTRGIAIDYERAIVQFRLRDGPRTGSRLEGPRGAGVTVRN